MQRKKEGCMKIKSDPKTFINYFFNNFWFPLKKII